MFRKTSVTLVIIFLVTSVMFSSILAEVKNEVTNELKKSASKTASENFLDKQEEVDKKYYASQKELYQQVLSFSDHNNQQVNTLIQFVGWISTIFGIIIALAGVFVGIESNRSRKRREEAINTLEGAKAFAEKEIKRIEEKSKEYNDKVQSIIQYDLDQLMQDSTKAADEINKVKQEKIKEIEESNFILNTEQKIEQLSSRIKYFSEFLPDDPKVLLSKAMIFKKRDEFKESLELLKKAKEKDPKNSPVLFQIGLVSADLEKYNESIEAYSEYIEINPTNASAYNNRGVSYRKLKKYEEALSDYRKAYELDGKEKIYLNNLLSILMELKKFDEVKEEAKKGVEKYKEEAPDIYFRLGNSAMENKNVELALEFYRNSAIYRKPLLNGKCSDEVFLNNVENELILGNTLVILKEIEKHNFRDQKFRIVGDFLAACCRFILDKDKEAIKTIKGIVSQFTEYNNKMSWHFDEIHPFVKEKLKDKANEYALLEDVDKYLHNKLTGDEILERIERYNK